MLRFQAIYYLATSSTSAPYPSPGTFFIEISIKRTFKINYTGMNYSEDGDTSFFPNEIHSQFLLFLLPIKIGMNSPVKDNVCYRLIHGDNLFILQNGAAVQSEPNGFNFEDKASPRDGWSSLQMRNHVRRSQRRLFCGAVHQPHDEK